MVTTIHGDQNNAQNVGIMGGHGHHIHDVSFNQLVQSTDTAALAEELALLRKSLRSEATEPEHDADIGIIAQAEVAAKAGDGSKAIQLLKGASRWTWDKAEKIGVGLMIAGIKQHFGI